MADGFKGLCKKERAAVAEYVGKEYDQLVFQQPKSYVSLNAQNDPDAWQEKLRELIASDAERVRNILDAAKQGQRWSVKGFTLIELSIVLVIIGLIVGGVLVGQSLINAAAVRAQITQIEKFNTAANTFRDKYGFLPGDIKDPDASNFGFQPRGPFAGEGDGNGIIEGNCTNVAGNNSGFCDVTGETVMFWVDLSQAKLIEGSFSSATSNTLPGYVISPTSAPISLANLLPTSKLSTSMYVYVWSMAGRNHFGLAQAFSIGRTGAGAGYLITGATASNNQAAPGNIAVSQAAAIDQKMDDGLPGSGNVRAEYIWEGLNWATPSGTDNSTSAPFPYAIQGTSSTCFDNNNGASQQMNYSVLQNNGVGTNCTLSFQMQAGD